MLTVGSSSQRKHHYMLCHHKGYGQEAQEDVAQMHIQIALRLRDVLSYN